MVLRGCAGSLGDVITIPRLLFLLAAIAASWSSSPVAASGDSAGPPAYKTLRYQEDWSEARAGETGDAFDRIKHVELGESGKVWASFGGQLRERVELWDSFRFGDTGAGDEDDVFLLHRLRAHADVHAGDTLRMFVELKSALATDRDLPGGERTLDIDDFDIQNGFIDVEVPLGGERNSLTLRGGRQELLFGVERLVGPSDWTNTRRTFDGVSAIWHGFDWQLHGFFASVVRVHKHDLNDIDDDLLFYGVYASGPRLFGEAGPAGVDVYWLGLEREDVTFNGTFGEEDRHTLGLRFWGPLLGATVDYEFEGAYQLGDVGGADIDAAMITAEAGLNVPGAPAGLRLMAGVDYASGDGDAGDGEVETFNQLFPTAHGFLGLVDTVARQNVIDLRGRATMVPLGSLRATLDAHYFLRASDGDALYDDAGAVVRPGTASDANEVGWELDLMLRQPVGRHLDVLFGYSHFFAGKFLEESGPDEDIDFAYLQGQLTF
jgi:hypothetical protein